MVLSCTQDTLRLASAGQHKQGSSPEVNGRRRRDADRGSNEGAFHRIRGNSSYPLGTREANLPQRGCGIAFGVESVNTIVFRGDVEENVRSFAWYLHSRHVQVLVVNVAF